MMVPGSTPRIIFVLFAKRSLFLPKIRRSLNKSTKIILNYVLGGALFTWLTFAIIRQIRHQDNLPAAWAHIQEIVADRGWVLLLMVILMMLVNWGIEARKWQILVRPLEEVPFRRAFGAILTGVSVSVSTPNRIGEYGGRMLYLSNASKLKSIAATIVGSFSQIIATLLFGLAGSIFYIYRFDVEGLPAVAPGFREKLTLALLIGVCVTVLFLYFRLRWVVSLVDRVKWLRKVKVFIMVIVRYSPSELRTLLYLSAIRYIVFTAQYLILLYALGVAFVWWEGFFMISVIYLVMAAIPTVAIAEIGLRGSVSLHFLGLLSANAAGILAATVAIWLINLVLPAAIGAVLLLGVKIFRDK